MGEKNNDEGVNTGSSVGGKVGELVNRAADRLSRNFVGVTGGSHDLRLVNSVGVVETTSGIRLEAPDYRYFGVLNEIEFDPEKLLVGLFTAKRRSLKDDGKNDPAVLIYYDKGNEGVGLSVDVDTARSIFKVVVSKLGLNEQEVGEAMIEFANSYAEEIDDYGAGGESAAELIVG